LLPSKVTASVCDEPVVGRRAAVGGGGAVCDTLGGTGAAAEGEGMSKPVTTFDVDVVSFGKGFPA